MARPLKIRSGRPAMPKAMLLPLSTEHVRRLQLQHHLALAALSSSRGDVEQLACLTGVVHLSYFLRDPNVPDAPDDGLALLQHAEMALDACLARAAQGEAWTLQDDEHAAIARLLIEHDAQLARVRMHRYLDAWERVQRVTAAGARSPLPAAVQGAGQGTIST
ncbi:hypothetical protein [Paraburkholderia megapolitana]|uniref:Fis family transcriptional regulator n=1 Tax=Paraburkholderia megapolitana TaxID=420953 RepID=A0A1I3VX39_9BURK|nr:hypothetical protein [Paraburkholderia megapolitana]QDQ82265.1 hypothetical protein FNZ07_13300 [Paraburkholderia megapolitana]SFJ99523.1 hypothetical protein SAMN05192543_11516 [Paraburkholderia megapolitana]